MRRPTRLLLTCASLAGLFACSDDSDSTPSTAPESAGEVVETTIPTISSSDATDATQDIIDVRSIALFSDLDPGRYFVDPDQDPSTPLRVTFDIAAPGWTSWDGAAKEEDYGHALFTVVLASNVVRDGCTDHRPRDPAVGPGVADLVAALTDLAPFEVTAPPSDVSISGYSGQHLQLTVPADLASSGVGAERVFPDCVEESLHSWIFPTGDSFFGYNGEPGRTEEFWILDVDGTRLVVSTNTSSDTPTETLTELQAIFDSMQIET